MLRFVPIRVRQIVLDIKETQGANKMLKKAVVGLFVIIALTLIALFGVSIAAGTALKEVRVYPLSNVVLLHLLLTVA